MSKKKNEEKEEVKGDFREELQKIINKKFGINFLDGSHIRDNPKAKIPTTPALDISLYGGIPEGSWTLITGKPKTGKTTLALQIAANAQRLGRHVYYLNAEQRFSEKNLTTVKHFQTTPDLFTLIESCKDKHLSSQDYLNIASDIVANHPGSVIILDSISSLCSDKEIASEIGEIGRADGPKMFGQFCRKNCGIVPINNIIFIGMLHHIANTSGYGAAFMEDGGNKIQFAADTKIVCKKTEKWEEGDKTIGQVVDWFTAYSANGAPGDVVKTYLRFGYGYDDVWEIICLGLDLGLISKAGAWYSYYPDENNPELLVKEQGQSKLHQYFCNNPDELIKLHAKVKEMAM